MLLQAPNGRAAFRVVDPKKNKYEDARIPPGDHEVVRVPDPFGGPQTWLVLAGDRSLGASEAAIRRDSTVAVIDDQAPCVDTRYIPTPPIIP